MFFLNSNIYSTMFVSVTSHTVYHSKLFSLYFCFVLEFNMWHRFGGVHPRFFCCSIIRRYQKETTAVNRRTDNAMSKSLEMSKGKSIMVRQIEYNPLWHLQTFGHCIVCPSIYGCCFLLISPDYSFNIF
jgi:hypothetical protein